MNSLRRSRLLLSASAVLMTASVMAEAPPPSRAQSADQRPAPSLEDQFRDPPASARPRVWWHWMNGNITKDGIAKDLAWMKRIGIGGAQTFDANTTTPQLLEKQLAYMTPEWKDAFRFAASEADRLDLELAIASSPGWTATGGPWVKPEDGMKKLVWSETIVAGGKRFTGKLPQPPSITGPFQGLKGDPLHGLPLSENKMPPLPSPHYADAMVIAVPASGADIAAVPSYADAAGKPLPGAVLTDADMDGYLDVPRAAKGPAILQITYPSPQTVRSAKLFMPGAGAMFFSGTYAPRLESSQDGKTWQPVAEVLPELVPTTVAFAPVTAAHFRLVFNPPKSAGFNIAPPPAGVDFSSVSATMSAAMAPKPIHLGHFQLSGLERIDRAEAKAGFAILSDYVAEAGEVPETKGVPLSQVIDLTGRLRPDGALDWTPPKGRWRVIRFGHTLIGTMNHPASLEATGLEVDKLNGAAVRRYLDHYLGMYKDATGKDLVGKRGVRALVNDSIEVGPQNWTPQLLDQFRKLRGYDPKPWLPTLIGIIVESRARSDQFLFDFRQTIADLVASEHYGTIANIAKGEGLIVYGEALESDRPQLGDDMALRSHTDVPMAAVWYFSRAMGPSVSAMADLKGAASVAHVYGQNLVAAETLTAFLAPWAFAPGDLKHVVDFAFASGVNRPVIHTSPHAPTDTVPGLALAPFGQHFNRHEAWAELAKPWVDYLARNSLMLQQGRNVADIAYFYGEEAPISGLYGEKPVADAPSSVGFDFINADALVNLLTNEGTALVTRGGARYQALYLGGSSRMMSLPTLRKIAALVEGGATIIGRKPIGNLSLVGDAHEFETLSAKLWPSGKGGPVGKGRIIVADNAEAALVVVGIAPDFRVSGGQPGHVIRFAHRQLAEGHSYFVSNGKDRAETIEAHFRVTGKVPELWHAETGKSEPVSYRIENGETVVPLRLAAGEAVHVVFRKPAAARSLSLSVPELAEFGKLAGPWRVTFQPNRGAPAAVDLPALASLSDSADTGIKYFSGLATYSASFTTPIGWKPRQPLQLDLGEVRELAEVTVNGKLAGYAWHAPYAVDVSQVAKPGKNALTIRVANTWVNRLIGDAQPGAQKVTWAGMGTYTAKAPLRRSGLIGPVRVLGEQK